MNEAKKLLTAMSCIALCGAAHAAKSEAPAGVETTLDVTLWKGSNLRALLLGPALEIRSDKGAPHWEWVYSEEKFEAARAAAAKKGEARKQKLKKLGMEPRKEKSCTLKLWWPEGVKVRGCFYSTAWGPDGRKRFKGSRNIQQFCRDQGLAFVGFQGAQVEWGFYPRAVMDEALRKLGEKAGHPELATLPFVAFGFSNGSGFATGCAMLWPERCMAWCAGHSNLSQHFVVPEIERSIGLAVHGMNDGYLTGGIPNPKNPTPEQSPLITRCRDDAVAYLRATRNAPVAFAMHPSNGHGMALDMTDFFAVAIKLRNPRQDKNSRSNPMPKCPKPIA